MPHAPWHSSMDELSLPEHIKVHWADPSESAHELARFIAAQLDQALSQKGRAVLSVSGGRSPVPMFEHLAQADIDWGHVTVTLVDERQVPEDHPASNARLVRHHLLQHQAAAAQLVPMVGPALPQGIDAWQDRANQISQTLQQVGPADVAVLGMGLDGHFASWFARSPDLCAGLDPQQAKACMAVRLIQPPAEAPFDRMSQTLAHLAKSALCVLPIVGEGKLKVWNQACRQAGPQWPVSAWLSMRSTPLLLWVTP